MPDLSTKKKKTPLSSDNQCMKDVYKARLQDIKKRLDFEKGRSSPASQSSTGSKISKFSAYGGCSDREEYDEAVIYGTEDEYWEEKEKEMKFIENYEDTRKSKLLSDAYYQGCEEFENSLHHIIKPNHKKREFISFRSNDDHPYVTEFSPGKPNTDLDGSEFLDGLISILPDDALATKSHKILQNDVEITKTTNVSKSLSKVYPSTYKTPHITSPCKETQTDITSLNVHGELEILQTRSEKGKNGTSNKEHPSRRSTFKNVSEGMESFAHSLEELDEAIFLHSLARKCHHHKHAYSRAYLEKIDDKRCYSESSVNNLNNAYAAQAKIQKDESPNSNTNAFNSDKNVKDNQDKFVPQNSTFMTESHHIDFRNHKRKTTVGDVKKHLHSSNYERPTSERQNISENISNSHRGQKKKLVMSGRSSDSGSSRRSQSSPRSEETLFNMSTDFSDKRLKQSNLYLEESPRNDSDELSPRLVTEKSQYNQTVPSKDPGPMSLKDLDLSDNDTETKVRRDLQTFRAKRSSGRSESKIPKVPKLNLNTENDTSNMYDTLDIEQLANTRKLKRKVKNDKDYLSSNTKNYFSDTNSVFPKPHLSELVKLDQKKREIDTAKNSSTTRRHREKTMIKQKRGEVIFDDFHELDSQDDRKGNCANSERILLNRSSTPSHSYSSQLLKDVAALHESVMSSEHYYRSDPERILLEATENAMDISRIENCSSIGPWEDDHYRNPSLGRKCNAQLDSSPLKESKTNQSETPYDKGSKSNKPYHKVYTKTGTEVNFVDLQEMHQDIIKRLRNSDNAVHVVAMECLDKNQLMTSSETKTRQSESNKEKTNNIANKNAEKDKTKSRSKKITKPKPIHVHSLSIKKFPLNGKYDGETDTHVTGSLQNGFNTSLVKFDRRERNSHMCPVRSSQIHSESNSSSYCRKHTKEVLDFEERGKKLDEICGILSHSSNKDSKKNSDNTDAKMKNVNYEKNHRGTTNSDGLLNHVDICFNKKLKTKDGEISKRSNNNLHAEKIKNKIIKQSKVVNESDGSYHEDSGTESDQTTIARTKRDDRNFNYSPEHKSSQNDTSKLKIVNLVDDTSKEVVSDCNISELSTIKSVRDDEMLSVKSEEDMTLTMSDLYTPVTQLISDEYDEGLPVPTTSDQLPLKMVYKNLKNKRKIEEFQKENKEGSNILENGESQNQLVLSSLEQKSGENITPLMNGGYKKTKMTSKTLNSVDMILSQLENDDAVRLLQKIYQADDITREQLIIKAECFKKWQNKVRTKQIQKTVYGPVKEKARTHCYTKSVKKYFLKWKDAYQQRLNEKNADNLYKHHMLKKGIMGLKWAISRSEHYFDIMKSRTQNIRVATLFMKWRRRTSEVRQKRLQHSFTYWYQFTKEQKNARILREQLDKKLLEKCYQNWIKRYHMKLKENLADMFAR